MFRKNLLLQPSGGDSTLTPDREVADCSETSIPNYMASQKTVNVFIIAEARPICPLFIAISILMSDGAFCR
jgi:hypothetical protein